MLAAKHFIVALLDIPLFLEQVKGGVICDNRIPAHVLLIMVNVVPAAQLACEMLRLHFFGL